MQQTSTILHRAVVTNQQEQCLYATRKTDVSLPYYVRYVIRIL